MSGGRRMAVAVVGAGISGLACARRLAADGLAVRVFEKSRGVGGRMATRRHGAERWDHGAQYFTVRDRRFARQVSAWRERGVAAPWEGEIAVLGDAARRGASPPERLVGVPGMSALCWELAGGLEVALGTRVSALAPAGGRWQPLAEGGAGLGRFDAVVTALPAPQAAALLAAPAPALAARAAAVEMAPAWAAMASFGSPLELGFDGAFVHGSPLSWVARNGSKPGRPESEAWVLHGSPGWSRRRLELAPEEAARRLLEAFADAIGGPPPRPAHLAGHRWRFAQPVEPLAEPCLLDPALGLGACGDWCAGPRVEGAYLSGLAMAERLIAIA